MAELTLKRAALAVGKDPSTLTRAVNNGTLNSTRNPQGKRVFDTSELIRVFGELVTEDQAKKAPPMLLSEREMQLLSERIEELQERVEEVREDRDSRVALVEAERDRALKQAEVWQKMADEKLPQLLEYIKPAAPSAPAVPEATKKARWWSRK